MLLCMSSALLSFWFFVAVFYICVSIRNRCHKKSAHIDYDTYVRFSKYDKIIAYPTEDSGSGILLYYVINMRGAQGKSAFFFGR